MVTKTIPKMKEVFTMKKLLSTIIAIALTGAMFAGCNTAEPGVPQLKSGESLVSVFNAIEADFVATHGTDGAPMMSMPAPLDDTLMTDLIGFNLESDVEEYHAVMAGMMPGFAEIIAVKAKEGKIDAVVEVLNNRKASLEAQYETYPVMGNYDRATNSEVYVKGNYAFLLAIGAADQSGEGGTYAEDVAAAKAVIDSMFE